MKSGGPGLPFAVYEADDVKPKKLAALDVVVIDTEGRPKRKELRQLADRADLILVPSGTSALELEATLELMDFLQGDADAARQSRVVLTRVPPVGRAGEEAREDLREAGATVCNTLVRSYAAYVRAAEMGTLARDVRDPVLTPPGKTCWRCHARCYESRRSWNCPNWSRLMARFDYLKEAGRGERRPVNRPRSPAPRLPPNPMDGAKAKLPSG